MTTTRTLLLSLLLFLSCDENLPSRSDPSELFSGHMAVTYSLSVVDNMLAIRLTLTNIYDEVIEGTVEAEGSITIALARDPSYSREFVLGGSAIDAAASYDRTTGQLQVLPGDSVSFLVRFDFYDDLGRDLRNVFAYEEDTTCPGRIIAKRETLLVSGSARLFPRVAFAIVQPFMFEICHVNSWFAPNSCTPITGPTSGCLEDSLSTSGGVSSRVPGHLRLEPVTPRTVTGPTDAGPPT